MPSLFGIWNVCGNSKREHFVLGLVRAERKTGSKGEAEKGKPTPLGQMKFSRGKNTKGQDWRENWGGKGDLRGRGKADWAVEAKGFELGKYFISSGLGETQLEKNSKWTNWCILKRKLGIEDWTKWRWYRVFYTEGRERPKSIKICETFPLIFVEIFVKIGTLYRRGIDRYVLSFSLRWFSADSCVLVLRSAASCVW